jgi:transposase
MAAVAAIRSNPIIRDFDLRLRTRGKPSKSALTACMRKLIVILNAVLRTRQFRHTPALAGARFSSFSLPGRGN